MLEAFIARNRELILAKARERVAQRSAPTEEELADGLPMFLDQLCEALRKASSGEQLDHAAINVSAGHHGSHLFQRGLTIAQVVHDYGDLCQVITAIAVEQDAAIRPADFKTLNLCLDDAIAGAVTEYAHQREDAITTAGTERLGVLAHELRNLLSTALMSFASIKKGIVAPGGSTSAIHERSLIRLHALIDSSLAAVRMDAGMEHVESVPVCEILEEVAVSAAAIALTRDLKFAVTSVPPTVIVEADRQILAAALTNLLQNALKFTRPDGTVQLRATATPERVRIDVQDECGGLPPGKPELLLRPFTRGSVHHHDKTGLGLGLTIVMKAVKAISGELRIVDLPGRGCIFSIDLPRHAGAESPSPR